jgi:ATP-binding cassette subfamily B protein RaxB
VLLARAFYRQPKLLFLDEGTANLDETTEEKLADLIAGLSITRIVVAHRPALVRRANKVFLMQDRSLHPMHSPMEKIRSKTADLLSLDLTQA